jgi:hypothetical protein
VDKTGKEIIPTTYESAGYCYVEVESDGKSYSCSGGSDYDYLKRGYLPVVKKAGKYSTPFGGDIRFLSAC